MKTNRPRPYFALVVCSFLAGCCHQPTLGPQPGGEQLSWESGEFPGGVVPSTYRMKPPRPASREMASLLPARPTAPPGQPTPAQAPQAPPASARPVAELLPVILPGTATMPTCAARDNWQCHGQSSGTAPLAELERPTTFTQTVAPSDLVLRPIPRSPAPAQPLASLATRTYYSHAADYSWLVGVLRQSPSEDAWTVRYASDQEDQYGGVLALVSPELMAGLHDGQLVLVEGDLVDPAPHEIKPAYHVRAIQHLQRP